jgi:hypothetical protein
MGIFYNRVGSGEPFIRSISLNGPVSLSDPYGGGPILDPKPFLPDANFTFTPYTTWALPSKNMPAAYMQNWNLILERQMFSDLLVRVGYVGSKGTHLLQGAEINPAIYGPGATVSNVDARRIYQPIGGLQLASSNAWSTYHSMQVTIQKRWSRNFAILSNYTWSKSIDPLSASSGTGNNTGPDPYNYNRNRGLSDFDVPHRLVVSGLWESPALKSKPAFVRQLAGGWRNNVIFTAASGAPVTIVSGVDNALIGVGATFADLTGVDWRQPSDRTKNDEIRRWFNPAAFRSAATGTFGTGGRNQLRDPGLWNFDYSLFKTFSVHESMKLQLRCELFNALNHANLGSPSTSVASVNFGQITSARSPRIMQLALRFFF